MRKGPPIRMSIAEKEAEKFIVKYKAPDRVYLDSKTPKNLGMANFETIPCEGTPQSLEGTTWPMLMPRFHSSNIEQQIPDTSTHLPKRSDANQRRSEAIQRSKKSV
jgi:hypothetical protein